MAGNRVFYPRRYQLILGWIIVQALLFPHEGLAQPRILGVRYWSAPSSALVVLELSERVEFQTFRLPKPPRLVTDLRGVWMAGKAEVLNVRDVLVDRIRVTQHSPGVVRVVMDLRETDLKHEVLLLPSVRDGFNRLMIEVEGPALAQSLKEKRRRIKREKLNSTGIVVIDPGHGGEDSGAVGAKGTREKDVVLAVAQILQRRLNQLPGIRAFLTRTGDYYLSLNDRVVIAQDYGADVLLSIHTDASSSRKPTGASVYSLSSDGATDEAARILAERENAVDLVGAVQLEEDPILNAILLDLMQTQTIKSSLNLSEIVIGELEKCHWLKFTMPRQAGFRVLRAPDIPSVLVEMGFISNLEEEALLGSSLFHHNMSQVLENSIRQFLCQRKSISPNQLALRFCDKTPCGVPRQNLSKVASDPIVLISSAQTN